MKTREAPASSLEERLAGVLIGTALGDALGLPAEGLPAERIRRRFGSIERFRLLGGTGFVSDDTEQSVLIAESLARHPDDPDACAEAFRKALLAWFLRLPWGVGLATIRACFRIAARRSPSGVMSAGNGAAMRAAVIGVFFRDDPARRREFGRALAEVTHLDPRAVEGALYVAEVAALCAAGQARDEACGTALEVVHNPDLRRALGTALELAAAGAVVEEAGAALGTSGFVLQAVPFVTYCFVRLGDSVLPALSECVNAGGDTDSNGAILGAWLGAVHGESGLPTKMLDRIHDGPFGPTHIRSVSHCLAARSREEIATDPPLFQSRGVGAQPGALSRDPGSRAPPPASVMAGTNCARLSDIDPW